MFPPILPLSGEKTGKIVCIYLHYLDWKISKLNENTFIWANLIRTNAEIFFFQMFLTSYFSSQLTYFIFNLLFNEMMKM